jgi:hypothetical protein
MRDETVGRTRRGLLGAGTGLVAAAAIIACASPAQADPLTGSMYVHVETTAPVPNTAPDYISGGDVLPRFPGTMGNPVALRLPSGQVLSVQYGVSGILQPPGSGGAPAIQPMPVVSEDPTGTSNEVWRFQRVGWIALSNHEPSGHTYLDLLDGHGTFEAGIAEPVYKIVNYTSAGHTCLDAAGDNPDAGADVTAYPCDPNQVNQTNQLWIVDSHQQEHLADLDEGRIVPTLGYAYGTALARNAPNGFGTLVNLASVLNAPLDNGHYQMYEADILSSGLNSTGHNSPSILNDPTNGFAANSNYGLASVTPPPGSPRNCVGYQCIIDPGVDW